MFYLIVDFSFVPKEARETFSRQRGAFTPRPPKGGVLFAEGFRISIVLYNTPAVVGNFLLCQKRHTLQMCASEGDIMEFKENELKVYPNPFSSNLHINFTKEEGESLNLVIYDLHGRIVKKIDQNILEGYNTIVWDATDFSNNKVQPGMYLIHFQSQIRNESYKIIYQRY